MSGVDAYALYGRVAGKHVTQRGGRFVFHNSAIPESLTTGAAAFRAYRKNKRLRLSLFSKATMSMARVCPAESCFEKDNYL
jgi:hypothetical protein